MARMPPLTVDVHVHGDAEVDRKLNEIIHLLHAVIRGERIIMSSQDDIDQATATLLINDAALEAAATRIMAEIERLKTENPAVDTSALVAALGEYDAATGHVTNIVPDSPVVPVDG